MSTSIHLSPGRRSLRYIPVVVFLLIFFALSTYKVSKPFIGHHDWDNVHMSNVVRNYIQ